MIGLELVVAVGAAILVANLLAHQLGVAAPVLLLITGLVLSLIPDFGGIGLESELVLLLFLPALLYWESLTTSLREIRRFVRGIILTGTVLVVVTAAVVAVVGHAVGLSWGTAWIIGAAVAPTDATAVAALGRALPGRHLTTLRAESLINDGTALVVYGVALGVVTAGEPITAGHLSGLFVVSFGGGILIGLAAGWLIFQARQALEDPLLGNVLTLLTPFATYLLAEHLHASGVLAVVTCGLFMSQAAPRAISARTRQQSTAFWGLTTFLLNGALFVLVGLELPLAVQELDSAAVGTAMLATVAVYLATLVARFVFLTVSITLIRLLDRRPQQRLLRTTGRSRVVSTVAGFRGAVSLAVALAVPTTLPGGDGFPAREMIVFVTAGVVVLTLVVQGLLLAPVIRWARLAPDDTTERELRLAQRRTLQDALAELPHLAERCHVDRNAADAIRREYEQHLALTSNSTDDAPENAADTADVARDHQRMVQLRLALVARKRHTVVRLRDERVIDDTVLRQMQARLDLEELRLTGPAQIE